MWIPKWGLWNFVFDSLSWNFVSFEKKYLNWLCQKVQTVFVREEKEKENLYIHHLFGYYFLHVDLSQSVFSSQHAVLWLYFISFFFLSTVVLDHIYSSTKGIFLLLLPLLKKPYIKWEKEQKIFWEDDNCHDLSKHMYPATRFLKLKYNFEYNNYSVFLKTNKNIFLKKYISSFWKQTPVSFVKKTYFQDCLQGNTYT